VSYLPGECAGCCGHQRDLDTTSICKRRIHWCRPGYPLSLSILPIVVALLPIKCACLYSGLDNRGAALFLLQHCWGWWSSLLRLLGFMCLFPFTTRSLSALLAGIITGIGAGIILRSKGSSGGSDILSVILVNRFLHSDRNHNPRVQCYYTCSNFTPFFIGCSTLHTDLYLRSFPSYQHCAHRTQSKKVHFHHIFQMAGNFPGNS